MLREKEKDENRIEKKKSRRWKRRKNSEREKNSGRFFSPSKICQINFFLLSFHPSTLSVYLLRLISFCPPSLPLLFLLKEFLTFFRPFTSLSVSFL
jgi:hypothetical protein